MWKHIHEPAAFPQFDIVDIDEQTGLFLGLRVIDAIEDFGLHRSLTIPTHKMDVVPGHRGLP
jgi:hypothetical protein